jgi:hypothetical protein
VTVVVLESDDYSIKVVNARCRCTWKREKARENLTLTISETEQT